MATDGYAIGSDKARFFYVYSRFGNFKTQYLGYVSNCVSDTETFLAKVETDLSDPKKARRAAFKLVTMRQRDDEKLVDFLFR